MATPTIVTLRDFATSRYGDLGEQSDQLPNVLATAEDTIQKRLNRRLLSTSYTAQYRPTANTLFVTHRPLISVTTLKRRFSPFSGWVTIPSSSYAVEAGPDYIEVYEPVKGYDVELTYVAGYAVVPNDIKEAIIIQTVLLLQEDIEVYGAGDSKEPGIYHLVRDIETLLAPYKQTATVYR